MRVRVYISVYARTCGCTCACRSNGIPKYVCSSQRDSVSFGKRTPRSHFEGLQLTGPKKGEAQKGIQTRNHLKVMFRSPSSHF